MAINLQKSKDTKKFAGQIKSVREGRFNMTQAEFAKLMGVSVSTLQGWEQARTPIPVYFMKALMLMDADPGMALGVLSGKNDTPVRRWDSYAQTPAQKSAAASIKEYPWMHACMETLDGMRLFLDYMRATDPACADFSLRDVMLLASCSRLGCTPFDGFPPHE